MADSSRIKAIDALVTTLQGINGAGSFNTNLSGTGQVSKVQDSLEKRRTASYSKSIRVRDGAETARLAFQNARDSIANFDLVLEIYLRDVGDDVMVDQFNDVLHDISLALGAAPTLGGAVSGSYLGRVEAPVYDSKERTAFAIAVVAVEYDFIAGTTI